VIARELVTSLRKSVTVDWMHRDAARARMRVLVKRILRKYGYPPDLQDAAVQTVLQQAEALSAERMGTRLGMSHPTSGRQPETAPKDSRAYGRRVSFHLVAACVSTAILCPPRRVNVLVKHPSRAGIT
jgi:hypothetical protein